MKYVTARCVFSLKCFRQDPGWFVQRLPGKELLRGHQIFGFSCTSLFSKPGMPSGSGRIEKVGRLGSLSLSVRLGRCQQSHLNRWVCGWDVILFVLRDFIQPQEAAWDSGKGQALEKDGFKFWFCYLVREPEFPIPFLKKERTLLYRVVAGVCKLLKWFPTVPPLGVHVLMQSPLECML